MGNLSEFLPKVSETVDRIYAHYKARGDAEPQRGYLGASVVGHECDRYLWFVFRGAVREDVEGRMFRLWQTGHREEVRLLDDLRAIGCEVHTGEGGEQFGLALHGGHFSMHMDAVALGVPEAPKTWHVVECKTHKDDSFRDLVKKGVRVSKPMHFAQMQAYMGGFKLDRALYLAHNKDTDELYSERVDREPAVYKRLLERAERIVSASKAPEKCSTRADDWRCKLCPAASLCWGGVEGAPAVPIPARSCKTCVHATAETKRPGSTPTWSCDRYKTDVDPAAGAECPTHLLLPGLVSFAEPTDSDGDSIEFTNRDGSKWQHGPGPGQWPTDELMKGRGPLEQRAEGPTPGAAAPAASPSTAASAAPSSAAAEPASRSDEEEGAAVARESLLAVNFDDAHEGGVFGEDPQGLLARYPWQDSWRVWDGPADQLQAAIENDPDLEPVFRDRPGATQDDVQVNAAEWRLDDGSDVLIVNYKLDSHSAIWRGKS